MTQATSSQTILDYIGAYVLDRPCSQDYIQQLRTDVRRFGEHLGRIATLADFTDENVNSFLVDSGTRRQSRITLRNSRVRLLAIWRHAFESGKIDELPRRVYKIKAILPAVSAWNENELAELLRACDSLSGRFMNQWVLERRKFARAVVLAAYESGARLGDIERWTWSDIDERGTIHWIQHKSRKPQAAAFSPEALAAMEAIRRDGTPLIFGGCLNRRSFLLWFKSLVKSAGLTGTFRWLRRTSGSLIERDNPGCGHKHLGNGAEVFRRHYDAAKITSDVNRRPKVPKIAGT